MRKLIAWALAGIIGGLWVIVEIKTILEFSTNDQKNFLFRLVLLLLVLGFAMLRKGKKPEKGTESAKSTNKASKSYKEIQEEHESYLEKLKSYKYWTIGCLLVAWIAFTSLRLFDHPQFSHPGFTAFIFCFALLLGTKDLEKQRVVDMQVVDCTMKRSSIRSKAVY